MWMNGNVSKEGIKLDLEAMHRVGISGVILFTSNAGIPRGTVKYGSREWFDLNSYAFAEAERLGMKIMLHNCPGYTASGGPWIKPENSMQQVVFSESFVKGDRQEQRIALPKPYAKMDYYEDALIIAYPALKGEEAPMQSELQRLFVNGRIEDKRKIMDYDYDDGIEIEEGSDLLLEFKRPFSASSLVVRRQHTEPPGHPYDGPRDNPPILTLEYSVDGRHFKKVKDIGMPALRELNAPSSINFDSVSATYYRIRSTKKTCLTELLLYTAPRLEGFETKANYIAKSSHAVDKVNLGAGKDLVIDPEEVIDLTALMSADGTLSWEVPEGDWTILRMGHTTTGEENAAAPFEAAGLECDKLNKRGIQNQYEGILKPMFEAFRPFIGRSFYGLTVDSWEAGTQNWTKDFEKEYALRLQKSMIPYIAAFTGRIVRGVEETERFLDEIRKLQASMLAENFHQELRNYCHQNGVSFASEPYGDGPFNSLEVGKYIDLPMGEFWAHGTYGGSHTNNQAGYLARTNNRRIAGAEAFTARPELSKFTEYPAEMKSMGDWMFTNGINRLIYHTYAHQPHPTAKPGMTMGPFGTHFNRNQTWWEQSKPYIDYVRRCQFMLQEGAFLSSSSPWVPSGETVDETQQDQQEDFSFVADKPNPLVNYMHRRWNKVDYYFVANGKRDFQRIIATFNIEGRQPEIWYPETGKQYDILNYKIEGGKTIVQLPMDPSESFFVVFDKAISAASTWDDLADFRASLDKHAPRDDIENTFTISSWLRPDVDVLLGKSFLLFPLDVEHIYGKNHAAVGLAVGQNGVRVFEQVAGNRKEVLFAEAKIEGWALVTLVYDQGIPTVFINGKKIKEGRRSDHIIHPTRNEISPVDAVYNLFQGEYTTPVIAETALSSNAIVSLFEQGKPLPYLPEYAENIKTLRSPWKICFPENSGAPEEIVVDSLQSLHESDTNEIKYFSGTATYSTVLDLPVSYLQQGKRVMLDLGNVAYFAEVKINNKPLSILWKAPFATDITNVVHEGENTVEIKVTNLWTNRLIGDELLPRENNYDKWGELGHFPDWYVRNQSYTGARHTFVSWKSYDEMGLLTESGLIGPVRIYLKPDQLHHSTFNSLEERIASWIDSRYYDGAGLKIVKDSVVFLEQYWGDYSDSTALQVASSGKWVAAAVIASIVEDGTLTWNTQVKTYLPEFTDSKGEATLTQLLSHTAGYPDYQPKGIHPDDYQSLEEAVAHIVNLAADTLPGATFKYGGLAMQVAGRMAELATGKNWETLFQEKIAQPLGMRYSYFVPVSTEPGFNPMLAGGFKTCVRDYLLFLEMIAHNGDFRSKRILSKESIRFMESDQIKEARVIQPEYVMNARHVTHTSIYGLGLWREEIDSAGSATLISSPGWAGAYPWVDRKHDLYGFLLAKVKPKALEEGFSSFYGSAVLPLLIRNLLAH
jgi:CubicO group peptidase (beta-lactamase class C family)